MPPFKIALIEKKPLCQSAKDFIAEFGELSIIDPKVGSDASVVFTRLEHFVDRELVRNFPNLKVIVTPTTGLTHIDEACINEKGIHLISLKGDTAFLENITATAEHSLLLMLALLRRLVPSVSHVKEYGWKRDLFVGTELKGLTLGIIGYGRLGKMMAGYGRAIGMNVLAYDTISTKNDGVVPFVSMTDLLKTSDVVSLHASFSEVNRKMIDRDAFSLMKRSSVFINTARGELVDEQALIEALSNKLISGAAIDVLADETTRVVAWDESDPILAYARKYENLLVTPHIGGATLQSIEKTEIHVLKKLRQFFEKAK